MPKEVAKKQSAQIELFSESDYTGFEDMGTEDLQIPFLRIAQATSDVTKKKNPAYIQDCEPGDFYNTALNKKYDFPLKVVPMYYFQSFIEWEGEGKSAQFIRQYTKTEFEEIRGSMEQDDRGRYITGDGHRISDHRNYMVILPDHLDDGVILYSMSGASIGPSRKWNSAMQGIRNPNDPKKLAPMFATVWELGTDEFSNDEGSWYAVGYKKSLLISSKGFAKGKTAQEIAARLPEVRGFRERQADIKFQPESEIEESGDF